MVREEKDGLSCSKISEREREREREGVALAWPFILPGEVIREE